ncbi:MAG: cupredoxin domain-containing protein [Rhodospirillaceae bacterium]|nr:cupredoxin domain-containing protein [Rhodospirillaceae bacterium]
MSIRKFRNGFIALAAVVVIPTLALSAGKHGGGHGTEKMPGGGHMKSGGHMKDGGQMGGHHGFDFGEPGKASEVSRDIKITMRDNRYEPEEINVKAGETIRFKITNKGEFLHEFGLGTAAMHAEHQKQMMVMMEHGMIEPDRINHDKMKMDHGSGGMKGMSMAHDDPNSLLLEPGKSGEIIWKFTKATELEFACNIPGHYESGMMGPLKVN